MVIEYEGQVIPVHTTLLPNGTAQYAEPFVEFVFTLYAQDGGRSVKRTRELLSTRYAVEIPETTMFRWQRERNWQVRARELYQLLRPGLLNETMDTIVTGASEGANLLRKMLSGEERPDATRMKIAFGLMDRAGLMPHSAVAEHIRLKMTDAPAHDTAALSDAELRELEASYQPDALHIPEAEIPEAQVVLAHSKRRPE